MIFNSYIFLLVFLPFSVVLYYFLNRFFSCTAAKVALLFLSFSFVAYSGVQNVCVLALSLVLNYILLKRVKGQKLILWIGIALNVVLLCFFKFFIGVMPLGLSFYTFQMIAMQVDCYRQPMEFTLTDFSLSVSFFPKLMQGPIVYASEIVPQLENDGKRLLSWDNISKGLYLFSLGLAKKVLIADNLGKIVDYGHIHIASLNSYEALITIVGYSFQLYYDFSGYCDMASGIALIFNIKLPINFSSPYKAKNIDEFWKGWHITLTRFLTKYIYIPLGGNRRGAGKTIVNILIVFLISGIWHGTGWTFIIWGLMHGIATVLFKLFKTKYDKVPTAIQQIVTFIFVTIAWVFFRSASVSDALGILKKVFTANWAIVINAELAENLLQPMFLSILNRVVAIPYLIAILLVAIFWFNIIAKNTNELVAKFEPSIMNCIVTTSLLIVSLLSFSGVSSFLYVNF